MSDSDQIKTDYDHSRETYYDLIQKGQESLDLMMQFARESEHPRAFEVLSGMIKNVSDVTDRLMDLQKKTKDVNKDETVHNHNTTNAIYVGSTSELQDLINPDRSRTKEIIDVNHEVKEDDE